MPDSFSQRLNAGIDSLAHDDSQFVPRLVDQILEAARDAAASDIHLIPLENRSDLQVLWRVDGVLHDVITLPNVATNVIARLKVLAGLLTYKTDVPQEGRLKWTDRNVELRLSTFPILSGEKGVVRLFVGSGQYRRLDDLQLPDDVVHELKRLLTATSGMLLVSGPAGSGKTTTLYACLRETLSGPTIRSICSLEDPVEAVIPGVSQSQVRPGQGFDYAIGLRSLVRQDPEVIMVGEIRDRETAATALQASLTGHLILTSFHAGSAAAAVSRLSDMEIESYVLRSGLLAIVSQRLLRILCPDCRRQSDDPADTMGLPLDPPWTASGCPACRQTGYQGRRPVAELLRPDWPDVGQAILARADATAIADHASRAGMQTCFDRAVALAQSGETTAAEVRRVFGILGQS